MKTSDLAVARYLLSADAVRARAHDMLHFGRQGWLADWRVDLKKLNGVADFVAEVVRQRYPDLKVPFHARWRHFLVEGHDLWAGLGGWSDAAAKGRAAFDLAITSVLLDAGAGMAWRYRDEPTGTVTSRSEGLAVASFRLFESGALSVTDDPLRADALESLTAETLGRGFQVTADNPLVGLEGRAGLLRRLGAQARARPDLFALNDAPRPGGLFDAMVARADNGRLPAPVILEVLLEALGPIWENRPSLAGLPLGDCWPHPAMPDDGFVPLHKLSQWLSYSLIEPLQWAGIDVHDIDGLTGLAEYRNGGLFFDMGVLVPTNPDIAERPHAVSDPLVVGWRAMTVALLDELAPLVRERLDLTAAQFPLARLLEGGAWAAGRITAKERRADGGPPFTIISDGTVF